MRKTILYACVLLLLAALNGCRSQKNTSARELPLVWAEGSPQMLFSEMLTRHEGDTAALIKTTATISMGRNSLRSKIQIRWQRDEAVQISILPLLGLEVFRVVVTPDSLYFVDRLRKQYAVEPYAKWQGYVPFDISFATLQSLLLSQPFLPGELTVPNDVLRFDIAEQGENYQYVYAPARPAVGYRFEGDARACLAVADLYSATRSRSLTCRYYDYRQQAASVAPQRIACELQGFISDKVNLTLESLSFEWNAPQNISAEITSKYKKVTDLESWIKSVLR